MSKRLHLISHGPQNACSYYRTWGVFSKLKDVQLTRINDLEVDVMLNADAYYVERPSNPAMLSACGLIKSFGLPLWIDYDDLLLNLPEWNPHKKLCDEPENIKSLIGCLKIADIITVATPILKEQYQKYTNKNIEVIPNAFNDYNFKPESKVSENKSIMWRGSATHRGDIIPYCEQIWEIADKYPEWTWEFFGKDLWYITDYIKNKNIHPETDIIRYFASIRHVNPAIHIVPLHFNKFNACKSNCAWLEGTYAGAAVLAPEMKEWQRDGITTFNNPQTFKEKLEELILNAELRAENNKKSLEYIKNNLLLSDVNKKRYELLNSLTQYERTYIEQRTKKITVFRESALAHKYCKGKGFELGAAAHNPFGLKDCINVAPIVDEKFFGDHQKEMCGNQAKIDIYATADALPFEDESYDYVVSSHVIEHIPDLIGAFIEWDRVIKKDGIIYMIFPKRNALPADVGRPLSTIADFEHEHKQPENKGRVETEKHVWVFDLKVMLDLIQWVIDHYNINWTVLETQETDDKVGNGHTIVCKKI